jgi:hypothetical protein
MAELVAARYPNGVSRGTRLELSGAVPSSPSRLEPFTVDWLDARGEIALHMNWRPQDGAVVLNSFLDGRWGSEQVVRGQPFPEERGAVCTLGFEAGWRGFAVSVDGRRLATFRHRVPPGELREVRTSHFFWRLEPGAPADGVARRGRADAPDVVPSPSGSGRSWTPRWVAAEPNPPAPEPLESFRFFCVLCTWLEEDVVEATVANAFLQGCERVYLVDNGSPDATVERAVRAGAILARTFAEGYFDEREKIRQMEGVVQDVSAAEGAEYIWWLYLDADEFYHGPGGLTLREHLATLDRRFRVVGARLFDHLPTGEPAYAEGRHPLDFQPLCWETRFPYCDLGHRKHHLRRWERGGAAIAPDDEGLLGFHVARSSEFLLEPAPAAFVHHFPFRAEETTRARLERLFGTSGAGATRIADRGGDAHMRVRLRSVDALYRGLWADVVFFPPCLPGWMPDLKLWEEWVEPADAAVARWY